MLRSSAPELPKASIWTEWSMTISAGASGLTRFGSPPSSLTASRMVARSTTHGTPVKSCMITRAGVNWISVSGSALGSQPASARTWSAVMLAPSSVLNRFSSNTLRLNGRFSAPSTEFNRKISYSVPATLSLPFEPKLSTVLIAGLLSQQFHLCRAVDRLLVRMPLVVRGPENCTRPAENSGATWDYYGHRSPKPRWHHGPGVSSATVSRWWVWGYKSKARRPASSHPERRK